MALQAQCCHGISVIVFVLLYSLTFSFSMSAGDIPALVPLHRAVPLQPRHHSCHRRRHWFYGGVASRTGICLLLHLPGRPRPGPLVETAGRFASGVLGAGYLSCVCWLHTCWCDLVLVESNSKKRIKLYL